MTGYVWSEMLDFVDFVNITSVYNFQQHTTVEDEIDLYKVSVRI